MHFEVNGRELSGLFESSPAPKVELITHRSRLLTLTINEAEAGAKTASNDARQKRFVELIR
jgi:hypothetical protein